MRAFNFVHREFGNGSFGQDQFKAVCEVTAQMSVQRQSTEGFYWVL